MKNMNLARWIILLSIVGSIALAITGYTFRTKRVELESALRTEVPALARDTQALAQRNSYLLRELSNEGLAGKTDDPSSYIRSIAAEPTVALGDVKIGPPREIPLTEEVFDLTYKIQPQDQDDAVDRLRISNFLYLIEKSSTRAKVTRIRIAPEQKSLKAHEISNDKWRWDADMTMRQKAEAQ